MKETTDSLFLFLDTSECTTTVALFKNQECLLKESRSGKENHAAVLHVLLDSVMKQCGVFPKQLSAVAWIAGPGSYTGLRIASSSAKGICIALGIPMIVCSTTRALAMPYFAKGNDIIVSMVDARRQEAFIQIFDGHSGSDKSPIHPKILNDATLMELNALGKNVLLLGTGAQKLNFNTKLFSHIQRLETDQGHIQPEALGQWIVMQYHQKAFADIFSFEPYYAKQVSIHGKPGEPNPIYA